MAIGNKRHVIRQAAMLVVFGQTDTQNALCPICGFEVNKGFTIERNGVQATIEPHIDETKNPVALHVSHIEHEINGGNWNVSNTFPAHKICNLSNSLWPLDLFCQMFQTVKTAKEIRQMAQLAERMADQMLNGTVFYPMIAKVALSLVNASKDYQRRTPQSLIDKLSSQLNAD